MVKSEFSPSTRFDSLDVFRGLTIAGMILVTNPGTYSAVYSQLRHSKWDGATATDIIFPAFLFIVGVAITLSFATRLSRGATRGSLAWHIFSRSAILFVLGLAVNGFPDYHWHTLRFPGILQRIALCYLFSGLIYLVAPSGRRKQIALGCIVVALLAVYWALLKWCPVPGVGAGHLDTLNNLPAYVDRLFIGTNHMWAWGILTPGIGVTYDPEGILSTLPAIASTLIGVLTGEWLRSSRSGGKKAAGMLLAGIVLAVTGILLSHFSPLNKLIWTSTFALFSSGVSLILFAILFAIVDLRRVRWWTPPALVLGTNAILAFVLSSIITVVIRLIFVHSSDGARITLRDWIYQHLLAIGLAPINASLAYAMVIVLLNMAVIVPLYRKRMFLKI